MSNLNILVSGAGIAGTTVAYFLAKAGCKVTVVERAPELRMAGQTVDIRGPGYGVIEKMGVAEAIKSHTTQEKGIIIVNENNTELARFGVSEEGSKKQALTAEIEIVRGTLAQILFDVTKDKVKFIFGETVKNLNQDDEGVNIEFSSDSRNERFDLVIAADGLGSRVRDMGFGSSTDSVLKSLGAYTAYYSMPRGETDTEWSRGYTTTGGRTLLVRPDGAERTRAFLTIRSSDPRLEKIYKEEISKQKEVLYDLFSGAGWEAERLLKGMQDSDDFYVQFLAQVKMDSWEGGRVTVVGDAGYCPTPMTGMGTSVAFVGAYILAGEVSKQPNDLKAALKAYDETLRPYVLKAQKLPPGAPAIATPQTQFGVSLLRAGAMFLYYTGIGGLLAKLAGITSLTEDKFKLPEYEAFAT